MKRRVPAKVFYVSLFCDEEGCGGECIYNETQRDYEEFEHECVLCGNTTTETKPYPCTETRPI